jgi:hypothetical protein
MTAGADGGLSLSCREAEYRHLFAHQFRSRSGIGEDEQFVFSSSL